MKKKIYAVKSGRKTGIYNEWQKCLEQTDKYPNVKFQGFEYSSELEEEPENLPGSLRYAIKEAKEFLGDLVYLGKSADCLEDVNWVEDGFLPFGNESEAEGPEFFPDKSEEDEEDIEEIDEEPDEWSIDNSNTLDAPKKSWEIEYYWKTAEEMKKCVELIKYGYSDTERRNAALNLKRYLESCLDDMNLNDLTAIYRGLRENNVIGYNPRAVAQFVTRLANRYPKP